MNDWHDFTRVAVGLFLLFYGAILAADLVGLTPGQRPAVVQPMECVYGSSGCPYGTGKQIDD